MANLALGTVQFGLDYGINNSTGKVQTEEIKKILKLSYKSGIRILDTSSAYGDAEKRLGLVSADCSDDFDIVSKYISRPDQSVLKVLYQSLSELSKAQLYGYLIHHFDDFLHSPQIWDEFLEIKKSGLAKKIGFSLYYPRELEYLFENNIQFDLIQIPYNLMDRRFEPYFFKLKDRGVEIHSRSVFLQGLFFKNPVSNNSFFISISSKLDALKKMADQKNTSISALALQFILGNTYIDYAVIGVDSVSMLSHNLDVISGNRQDLFTPEELSAFIVEDEQILLPFNWRLT